MRTLKKSLALVLALVMLLGLGVVGASADNALDNYTDADEIGDAYLEAVGVLTGLGIVDGMTETTIVPQATYTRAQAAKIITTMVLGVNGAKSCVASYAPFDDVAANHWAAGYIAFCKEQGIIDGVTDTTFDPEGTLTGYQWAKMLLAAVGFNANNELEGSSWSLNTARIGREVGLFDGDLAGADHTPLRREQAMLYAFNTLSGIKQVTYSANATNYVYGIKGYVFADGTGYTLGEKVFKLAKVEGQIIDNEGMGNANTVVDSVVTSEGNVAVDANTGLDLMYHAVRVWYVVDDKGTTATRDDKNVGVYTYDLASTDSLTCPSAKAVTDLNKKVIGNKDSVEKNIGDTDKLYEYVIVDNTALGAGYAKVSFEYYITKLGVRSTAADTTVIAGKAVKNDYIKTDITDIHNGDDIMVLKASEKAYYVYAFGATSGTVTGLDKNDNITLSDGTVLKKSVLAVYNIQSKLDDIEDELAGTTHVAPNYSFILDTHGHYVDIDDSEFRMLAYYTGADRIEDPGAYDVDAAWLAQFIEVGSGDIVDVPVTDNWYKTAGTANYYDITNMLYGDDAYEPILAFKESNEYYGYVYLGNDIEFKSNTYKVSGNGHTVTVDMDDTPFQLAIGAGKNASVGNYDNFADLLGTYAYNMPASSITLDNVVVDTTKSAFGNDAATLIFSTSVDMVVGGVVFFPNNVTEWDEIHDDHYVVDSGYVNGSSDAEDFKVRDDDYSDFVTIAAGFYNFKLDADGYAYDLVRADFFTVDSTAFWADSDASDITITYNGKDYNVDPETVVVADTRDEKDDVDTIDELVDLMRGDYSDPRGVQLACTYSGNDVTVIYVVNSNYYVADVDLADATGLTAKATVTPERYSPWYNGSQELTVTLTATGDSTFTDGTYVFTYTVNGGAAQTATVKVDNNNADTAVQFKVNVPGNANANIVITACSFTAE